MQHADDSRVELRETIELNFARLDGRIGALEARIDARIAAVEARIDTRVAAVEARIDTRFAEAEAKFERRFNDLLKWSFVFWCGAVTAIAALAKVLR
jgi:hypothetical protein